MKWNFGRYTFVFKYYRQRAARMADSKDKIINCKHCGRTMTRGRFGTRKFCSNACRQAHYRERKTGRPSVCDSSLGGIYFILGEKTQLVKIGMSQTNLEKRISALSSILPEDIRVLRTIKSSNAYELEKKAHLYFQSNREKGEWFSINTTDITSFLNWLEND